MQENKPVLIIENCQNKLSLNESANAQHESMKDPKLQYILTGIFTEFGIKNRNERIYTAENFIPCLNEMIERKNALGVLYGEFDHPDVFDTSFKRSSHVVLDAYYVQESNRIDGTIQLLPKGYGENARSIVDMGLPLFVSSRAAGITLENNSVSLKKLFTYDVVPDPGFASAKMSIKSVNESMGYNESANFRIFEIEDEQKINELFNMNKNDAITKMQFDEYSLYIKEELTNVRKEIDKTIKNKNVDLDPKKLEQLFSYYENLNKAHSKISGYLEYLGETLQIVVNENKTLKETTSKLVEHNDHLVEKLNQSIEFSNYLTGKLDSNIEFSNFITEKLDNTIEFSEFLSKNINSNIGFTEHVAEQVDYSVKYLNYLGKTVDQSIIFSEHLGESINKGIKYTEQVGDILNANIAYSNYLAKNLDENVLYVEHVAEHTANVVRYGEYIATELTDTQAYNKYLGEAVDQVIDVVKSKSINENIGDIHNDLDNLKVNNVDVYYEEDEDEDEDEEEEIDGANPIVVEDETEEVVEPVTKPEEIAIQSNEPLTPVVTPESTEEPEVVNTEILTPGATVKVDLGNGKIVTGEVVLTKPNLQLISVEVDGTGEVVEVQESKVSFIGTKILESETSLKENILNLINEAKKRKASEIQEPHFLLFLNEEDKMKYNDLSNDDKEKVIVATKESKYTNRTEALNAINESLSGQVKKTFEETLLEKIPTDLKTIWESLDTKIQNGVFAQAKLYTNLNSDNQIVAFWESRNLKSYKKIENVNENLKFIDNSSLSDDYVDSFMNAFKNLK